jgi:oxalate decarboxylase/phosphoglucose isomerase-like protein (cupin superfamily)
LSIGVRVEPGGGVPTHSHPSQEERFSVVDGQVFFRVGRDRFTAGPGAEVLVPPGTKHRFHNRSGYEASFRALLTPGTGAAAFFTETAALAREGLFTQGGLPKRWRAVVRGAELLDRYRDQVVIYNPPPALQRLLVPLVLRWSR